MLLILRNKIINLEKYQKYIYTFDIPFHSKKISKNFIIINYLKVQFSKNLKYKKSLNKANKRKNF